MAQLVFHVASDWEEVVKLRTEIAKLKQELKSMDSTQSPVAFKTLNTQLSASTQRMDELVTNAAKAGAVMEGDFKKKIFDASQTVNGFTERIIAQKAVVKDVEADVKRLGDAYRTALKRNPMSANGKLEEYKAAKKALDEEKATLFGLTQQQAEARLSVKKLRDEYALYKDDAKDVAETNNGIAISWKKALAVIGGAGVLKALGSEIIRVRGEFQAADTAIQTLLGSKEKADALMKQVREYAKISPLEFSDVTAATQMMLGFNIEAEKVPRYLQAIGDISMGETGKFNSLTLAFSQMSATGKLMGQDMNQMINAGFNPLQAIADKTGKSIEVLKDEMSKGAISAKMVQQAFIDATSAGGKFYNMSENASKTINGQISMMHDALDAVFNELGTKGEGVIIKGIQMTTSLIENYETVGKVLVGLITTYGVYKAGLLVALAVEQGTTKAIWAKITATKAATVAQAAFNKVAKANPYVLLASLAIGAATAIYMFSKRTTEAQEVQRRYNASKEVAIRKEEEHRQEIQRLINVASDEAEATANRNGAIEALKKVYPGIIEKYIDEEGHLRNLIQLQKELNEEQSKRKAEDNQTKLASINDKVRNQEEYVSRMSGSKEAIKEANDVLKELQRQQKEAQSAVNADYINARLEEAKKLSDDELRKFISQWKSTFSKVTGDMIGEFSRDEVSSFIKSLETLQSAREKLAKNKSYWEKQKKEANAALESIASSQKKLMDAGKFEGIDTATVKTYKDNVKKLKEAEKELKVYDSSSKQENQAEKLRKQQEQLSEQLLSLRRKNQQDAINLMEEGNEKKLKQIAADFESQKQEIEKKAKELAEANKKAGVTDVDGNGLTAWQQSEIDKANKLNVENRKKAERDLYKSEADAMRNYLKEYGTFQQQKLAIAEEYAEKIRKAQSEGGRLSLEKDKNAALQQVEVNAIKQSIDWGSVFGEFGAMFKEQLEPAIGKLKTISRSDEFKSSSLQDQQTLYELISKLEQSNASWDSDIFKKVSNDMVAYQTAMQNYINAQEREKHATEALAQAKRDLEKAEKSGNSKDALNAHAKVVEAQFTLNAASDDVKHFGSQVQQTTSDLQSSSAQAVNMFQNLESGLKGITSGSLQGIGQGLMQLDKLFNKGGLTKDAGNVLAKGFQSLLGKDSKASKAITEALGSAGMTGEIISAMLGILDMLKDGFSGIIISLQDTIFNAIEGILDDVFSGDILVKPIQNAFSHIGNILDTVTFGGFSSWFGIGGNKKEVEEAINRLTDRNETLQTAIEDLTDEMKASKGMKSVDAYEEAVKYQKETNDNYKRIAQEQARYSGSHHSWNYYWGGFSQEQTSRFSKKIGREWDGDIWNLSPEEMKMLRETIDMWETIQKSGKGGYGGRLTDKLNDYIDQAGKLEELMDNLYEGLTGMTFDSMYDSFVSSLMDMEKSAEDVADDISKYFMQAMLSNAIGEQFSDKLKAWYDKFGESMRNDGTLDEKELGDLKDEYMKYVEEAMKLRDELAAATGYDKISNESSSQSSTSRGFGTEMTHEDAGELSGRFTALQITEEEIKNQSIIQTQSLNLLTAKADTILSVNTETRNIADETRDLIAQSYLELVHISENTGAIVKPIQQIQKDIAEVKKNTSKL